MKRNYDDDVYASVRMQVLKRDKFTCQMPGCKQKKRLEVHHIVPWSQAATLRHDKYNCITLCKEHHKEVTGKENIYADLFTNIVYSKRK
tara:strand:- start:260 stop:526 length:267 start_codon:yes stop_codon:yes gene_type:complete